MKKLTRFFLHGEFEPSTKYVVAVVIGVEIHFSIWPLGSLNQAEQNPEDNLPPHSQNLQEMKQYVIQATHDMFVLACRE